MLPPFRLLTVALVSALPSLGAQQPAVRADYREFVIRNFATESGVTLPEARVRYGTYGTLNAARDNAVLLPSHYMANYHGYEWLIGPGKALDTTRLFLVATELFGNGRSTSPSNTPEPYHGPRFPVTTIRDNVLAVRRLLEEDLGITHLRAVIGFSMGAQQAFQWGVSYPAFVDRIVATAGTAKTWPHGVVRLAGQIAAIEADATFNNGDYTAPPIKGLEAFAVVWTAWLFSQEWWRRELWKARAKPGTTFEQVLENYRKNFIPGADANDLILQMRTWEKHDVSISRSPTRVTKRSSCRACRLCRFRRCGDIRREQRQIRRMRGFSTPTSRRSWRAPWFRTVACVAPLDERLGGRRAVDFDTHRLGRARRARRSTSDSATDSLTPSQMMRHAMKR